MKRRGRRLNNNAADRLFVTARRTRQTMACSNDNRPSAVHERGWWRVVRSWRGQPSIDLGRGRLTGRLTAYSAANPPMAPARFIRWSIRDLVAPSDRRPPFDRLLPASRLRPTPPRARAPTAVTHRPTTHPIHDEPAFFTGCRYTWCRSAPRAWSPHTFEPLCQPLTRAAVSPVRQRLRCMAGRAGNRACIHPAHTQFTSME